MTKSTIVERKIEETTQNVVSIKRFSSNRLPSGAPSVDMRCFINEHPYTILEIALRGDTLESGLPILAVKMDISFCSTSVDLEDDFRRSYNRKFGHWRGFIYSSCYLSEDDRRAIAEFSDGRRRGQQLVEADSDYADIEHDFERAFNAVKTGDVLMSALDLIDDYRMNLDIEYGDADFLDQNISTESLAEAWESGRPTPWPEALKRLEKPRI